MPEGDAVHRAASSLQVLAGQRVEVETPHPRAATKGLVDRLDGRRLESVEAVGENLPAPFEGWLRLPRHPPHSRPLRVRPRRRPAAAGADAGAWGGPAGGGAV